MPSPLVPPILAVLDTVRSVGGMLGMRSFKVYVTRRVWTGGRPGQLGASYRDTSVQLTNTDPFGHRQPAMVRQVARQEAIASGGQYTNRDIKVGPITPSFAKTAFGAAGGFDDNSLDPAPSPGTVVQMIWWMTSATTATSGLPASGIVCDKLGEEATAMHYYAVLRATGRQPTQITIL
jgi:hypothetical protein